jgi:hypothetical protein
MKVLSSRVIAFGHKLFWYFKVAPNVKTEKPLLK